MKKIKIVETEITNSQAPEGFLLNYRREFLRIVEFIPEGATASQMGAAIRIARKLDQCSPGQWLYLEDAEWEYLKNKAAAARFTFAAPEIVAMVEAVQHAEEAEAPHLAGEKQDKTQNAGA